MFSLEYNFFVNLRKTKESGKIRVHYINDSSNTWFLLKQQEKQHKNTRRQSILEIKERKTNESNKNLLLVLGFNIFLAYKKILNI